VRSTCGGKRSTVTSRAICLRIENREGSVQSFLDVTGNLKTIGTSHSAIAVYSQKQAGGQAFRKGLILSQDPFDTSGPNNKGKENIRQRLERQDCAESYASMQRKFRLT
jgi:hypothetical protein